MNNYYNIDEVMKYFYKISKIDCFDIDTTKKMIDVIKDIPNGVYYRDPYTNPLASLNIGKIESHKDELQLSFSIRSNRICLC